MEIIERDGELTPRPHVAIPVDQAWFWSDRWQAMEREADADFAGGRSRRFDDVESLLDDLER